MSLFFYSIYLSFPLVIAASCTIPPDFWCDHSTIAKRCGAEQYCRNYKTNMVGRKFNLTLYFETHCPDSQLFIVDRLYPKVINNTEVDPLINADFHPWGMAIRDGSTVRCKHKLDRTCQGNKLISCAIQHITDVKLKINYIYCFEGYVLLRLPIEFARDSCYKETNINDRLREAIRYELHHLKEPVRSMYRTAFFQRLYEWRRR